jgi:hypothetical protein
VVRNLLNQALMKKVFHYTAFAALVCQGLGCVVSERCYEDRDCQNAQVCGPQGQCQPRLDPDSSLPDGRVPIRCPRADMVNVNHLFCIDRFEASRTDATSTSEGTSTARATNRQGVLPWQGVTLLAARTACKAAGKYLCRLDQWPTACRGPNKTVYSYGDTYDPAICNGIDAYCACSSGPCAATKPCPYPHCFYTCGADFKVDPTGSRLSCKSAWGAGLDQAIYDINGNVWELADSNDGLHHFRGGAYNCSDSEALHRCDHDGTWGPSARGFRCCADGVAVSVDAGPTPDLPDAGPSPDVGPTPELGLPDAAPTDLDAAALDAAAPDAAAADAAVQQ